MKTEAAMRDGEGRVCANAGCARPAEGELCDECALEWALFHREQRETICRAEADPPAAPTATVSSR